MAESQMAPPVDWILLPEVYSWLVKRGYWRLEGPEYNYSVYYGKNLPRCVGQAAKYI